MSGASIVSVSAGQMSSGILVSGAGSELVIAGGTAISTTISAGGSVADAGLAISTQVLSGGTLIDSGGTDSGTIVGAGGTALTLEGNLTAFDKNGEIVPQNTVGTTEGITIGAGGVLVENTPVAVVYNGNVYGSLTVSGVTVQSGGLFVVSSGDVAYGVTLQAGALLVADNSTVVSGAGGAVSGTQLVELTANGGSGLGTMETSLAIGAGTALFVQAGDEVGSLGLGSGASAVVDGGSVSAGTVAAGAVLSLANGAVAEGLVLGGSLVMPSGTASGTIVERGGVLSAYIGSANATVVQAGGLAELGYGSGNVVQSGGQEDVLISTSGDVVEAGGTAVIDSVAVSMTISSGATVIVGPQAVLSAAVIDPGATVVLIGDAAISGGTTGGGATISTGIVLIEGASGVVFNPAGLVSIGSGAAEYVLSGATALSAVVASGGAQNVEGGVTVDTQLHGGGTQFAVEGIASGTTASSGGLIFGANFVGFGGTEISGVVLSGGVAQGLQAAAVFANFTVSAGGQVLDRDGTVIGTMVSSGGLDIFDQANAQVSGAIVSAGGAQLVIDDLSNEIAYSTTVQAGGLLENQEVTSGAVVSSGGVELVVGGRADATSVAAGGFVLLLSGAQASGTLGAGQVISGGVLEIAANGSGALNPSGVVSLGAGAAEYVAGSGVASGAIVGVGAQQTVFSLAENTLVEGGVQYLSNGATSNTVLAGGTEIIPFGQYNYTGTPFFISGGTAYNTTIGTDGVLDYGGGALSGSVVFSGVDGVLNDEVADTVSVPGSVGGVVTEIGALPVISGFAAGDKIILPFGIVPDSGPVISGGVLTFDDVDAAGAAPFTITFAMTAGESSGVSQAADGAVEITALCFLQGTMIATPDGETPVERLAIGDVVTTHAGPRPVKWLGRRAYGRRFVAGEPMAAPVCIAAGALGDGLPRRDLHVSPGHGVLLDGQLIPAWRLINGVSITQPAPAADVVYTHIELEDHAIVYAEGAPAETFLDVGLRGRFQNAAEYEALYPGPAPDRTNCFPRLEEGFLLQSLQQRVAKRAGVAPRGLKGRLTGAVEAAGPGWAVGWALDDDAPGQPVCLDVMVYGVPVRRVLANRYRPELRARGLGDGACGFAVQLPADLRGPISVRRSEDHAVLAA